MLVTLMGLSGIVGVWAHWSLQHIRGFCGSSDWLQEKFGVLQIAPVEEAAGPWQAGCIVHLGSCVHFLWYLLTKLVERQRDEGDVALSLATLPLSANAGLLPGWVINICGSSSKSLPWALLNLGFLKLHDFLVCFLIPGICLMLLPCFLFHSLFCCSPNK